MTTNLKLTTAQRHILRIQSDEEKAHQAFDAAAITLGNGYEYVWALPDVELQGVLQELYDTPAPEPFGNELRRLLTRHYMAATALNAIRSAAERPGVRCAGTAPRAWNTTDGRIELIPLPLPQPEPETEPQPEPQTTDEPDP